MFLSTEFSDKLKEGLEKGKQIGLQEGLKQGIEQGIEQGITQGKSEGRTLEKINNARNLIKLGKLSLEDIANVLELDIAKVEELAKEDNN